MDTVPLFRTPPHPCGYFQDRRATSAILDPRIRCSAPLYGEFMKLGFRRSGEQVYRPTCPTCNACLSVRIPVAEFHPHRSQRRIWRRNEEVEMWVRPAGFVPAHYALYLRYVRARHPGGGMDEDDPGKFLGFLTASWCETRFLELREEGRLLAVAVTDITPDALSALYTFYDPSLPHRGLGTLAILHQIALARRLGKKHLYLGYWIEGHPKMDYKRRFQPLEIYRDGAWSRLGGKQRTSAPAASQTS